MVLAFPERIVAHMIYRKLLNSVMNRVSRHAVGRHALVEAALRCLPEVTYSRLRTQGFRPGGIIDIGAHEGHWTKQIKGVFPEPPVLMIEARREQEPVLQQVCVSLPGVSYAIALLGQESKEAVSFHVSGTGSSIFAERSDADRTLCSLPMQTLDDVVAGAEGLLAPLFLKLDVQGAELECLRGAPAVFDKTEVLQLEVALLNYNESAPLVAEVIAFMAQKRFLMFDIAGFVRPNGRDLVQIDVIFVKKDSKLRRDFFRFNSGE